MKHTCHLPGCSAGCPPAHLFCRKHWMMVPVDLKAEVNRTVKLREKTAVNASWAPWWRAQALATVDVGKRVHPGTDEAADRWLAKEMAFAEKLEA